MSTREHLRLIARAPFNSLPCIWNTKVCKQTTILTVSRQQSSLCESDGLFKNLY